MKRISKKFLLITNIFLLIIVFVIFYRARYYDSVRQKISRAMFGQHCENAPSEILYEDLKYKWTKVNCNAAFPPRDGAGSLVYKNVMWLFGGWNPENREKFPEVCNNAVWNSTDGFTWNLVRENEVIDPAYNKFRIWEPRHTAGWVVFRDKMWVIGGDANQVHYQFDVWNSSDGMNWEFVNRDNPVPWGPRVLHYTLVFKDKIWVMGGQTIPQLTYAEEKIYNDVWNTEDGINWVKVETNEPMWQPRGMIGGNAVFQGKMWVIGGGTYDTPSQSERKFFNDVWNSEDGIIWTLVTGNAGWEPRQYHDVALFDSRLWVVAGYNNEKGNMNDVWYSDNGKDWIELPDTPWKARHASCLYVYNGSLWVVAGNNMESDVWKLSKY